MSPAGFETTISAGERPQTYALDRAATGTGNFTLLQFQQTRDFKIPLVFRSVQVTAIT